MTSKLVLSGLVTTSIRENVNVKDFLSALITALVFETD